MTNQNSRISLAAFLSLLLFASVSPAALAWDDHSLGTIEALSSMPEITGAAPVAVESIESFLTAEQHGLVALTDDEEAWARAHVPTYPARPDSLRFTEGGSPAELRTRFLHALRLNPTIKLALFLQRLPGQSPDGHPSLPKTAVTILSSTPGVLPDPFEALTEGERVAPIEVATSAADEPDYGHDIGLWQDNGTAWGAIYGFGKQPFGNPAYDFSSQAPFHMGYYHEASIIYKAAPFLRRTYPEIRIHQFLSLARFAFTTGHPYWGYRFAGWGMHYIQDLTQPYHATVFPGQSVPALLSINLLDLLGMHHPKANLIQLVSNRHFAIENFELESLKAALATGGGTNQILRALRGTSGDGSPTYDDSYPRSVISARSHSAAKRADELLKTYLPKRLVRDPHYQFGVDQPIPNTLEIIEKKGGEAKWRMNDLLADLMSEFGVESRAYLRAALR